MSAHPTLSGHFPCPGAMYRTYVACELLSGFTDGLTADEMHAVLQWGLLGRTLTVERQVLVSVFAAPHVAAIDEAAWQGDPLAEAERHLMAAEVKADELRSRVIKSAAASIVNDSPGAAA